MTLKINFRQVYLCVYYYKPGIEVKFVTIFPCFLDPILKKMQIL